MLQGCLPLVESLVLMFLSAEEYTIERANGFVPFGAGGFLFSKSSLPVCFGLLGPLACWGAAAGGKTGCTRVSGLMVIYGIATASEPGKKNCRLKAYAAFLRPSCLFPPSLSFPLAEEAVTGGGLGGSGSSQLGALSYHV